MKRILALCVALAVLALVAGATAEEAELKVSGTGIVNLDADVASISLGVRKMSADVADAQAQVNACMAAIIEKLESMGVLEEDIHTASMSIYPDYSSSSLDGATYTADNTVVVTTKDIDHVGALIDAAFEAGANEFNDISFSASDTTAESKQALALAVENARDKAEVLAKAAGMKLGALKSIQEQPYSYVGDGALFARATNEEAADGMTRVYANQLRVSASVTVVFTMVTAE